jgi:DNA-binding NarL/FixJ family response regulator
MKRATEDKPQLLAAIRPRVVIADDDEVVRTLLAAQLGEDFECVGAAADATHAVVLVSALKPDVVVLDVNMPGGGAIQATREIRACAPDTAIVILSIDETWSDLIDLLNAGAMTYLRKGIDDATLTHDLHAAIRAHRQPVNGAEATTGASDADTPLAPANSALFGLIDNKPLDGTPRAWTEDQLGKSADAA